MRLRMLKCECNSDDLTAGEIIRSFINFLSLAGILSKSEIGLV